MALYAHMVAIHRMGLIPLGCGTERARTILPSYRYHPRHPNGKLHVD